MRKYIKPEINLEVIEIIDVIAESGIDQGNDQNDTGWLPWV